MIPIAITREIPMRTSLLVLFAMVAIAPARAAEPEYVEDDAVLKSFTEKLGALAKKGKCLAPAKLKKLTAKDSTAKLASAKPNAKVLSPEELAASIKPSVFIVGSVSFENGECVDGRMATAWVLGSDGVLVTNWHVFDEIGDDEYFGATNATGEVFPITGVLARDKAADIAIVRIGTKGLTPLPVATSPAKIGSWVGVLGHPGDRYYSFTQGHVTRYTKYKNDDDELAKWMAIGADYAYGSSGSPVVDRFGHVVGMAALTENIDYPDEGDKAANTVARKRMLKLRKKADDKPKTAPSALQMVVKLTVPAAEMLRVMGAGE